MKRSGSRLESRPKRQNTGKTRVLFVGNVCVDICVYAENYPEEDSKTRTNEVVKRRGGNAATSAIVASYLGTPNVFVVGNLGSQESTEVVRRDFDKAGVDYSYCIRKEAPQNTSYIVLSRKTGSRTIVHHPSLPPIQARDFQDAGIPLKTIKWAHFEGRNYVQTALIMSDMHMRYNTSISVEVEKIRRDGDIEYFIQKPYIKLIFVSKDYVKARNYDSAEAFYHAFAPLCDKRKDPITVVIPWGERGAYAYQVSDLHIHEAQGIVFSKAKTVKVKETLGAGDTFNGAFLHAFIQGKELKESLDFANMVAGHKVAHDGFECINTISKL